jgi:hypothetical protein
MDFFRAVWKNYLEPIQAGVRPMISDDENRVQTLKIGLRIFAIIIEEFPNVKDDSIFFGAI